LGRITKIATQPINLSVQFYENAAYPAGTSQWSLRMQLAFLFPRLSRDQQKQMLEKKLKELDHQSN